MRDNGTRFTDVILAIDAVNAEDPNLVGVDGKTLPAEFVYGHRMSETLGRMDPDASECLQIAARGQHIGRWRVPRKNYPAGRSGYLEWRRFQRDCQAKRLGDLMAHSGYGTGDIERVGSLIKKKGLKTDADAQMLEDVICVAFLEHYLPDFMTRIDEEKLAGILAKTWKRMSEHGHQYALQLRLPDGVPALLERGLNAPGAPDAALPASRL
jgi:uncharacterized protein DUF4202